MEPKKFDALPQEKVLTEVNWTDFGGFMKSRRIFVSKYPTRGQESTGLHCDLSKNGIK